MLSDNNLKLFPAFRCIFCALLDKLEGAKGCLPDSYRDPGYGFLIP